MSNALPSLPKPAAQTSDKATSSPLLALPDHSQTANNSLSTVSRPNKLAFKYEEFMALLGGKNIDQLVLEAERQNDTLRIRSLRMTRQLLNQNPCYLTSEPHRLRYEIAYIKLSVLQRIITSVRESHRILGLPLDVQQLEITAEWAAASAIVPLLWNYRLMTVPAQSQSTSTHRDVNNSFPNDAFHFGLLLAESLLCNRHFDRITIRERVVTQSVNLNGRFRSGKTLTEAEIENVHEFLQKIIDQREFCFHNVQFESDFVVNDSVQSNEWRDAMFLIFKLTTRIPGFSFYHSLNSYDKQVVSLISQEVTRLVQAFKQKMFTAPDNDASIAALLQEILQP